MYKLNLYLFMTYSKKNKICKMYQEVSVLQLINRHFWKSKTGPLSAFIIPIFLMIMYRVLAKDNIEIFASGLPSYFSFSILPLCFISLSQMIVEFKTSIILRKIYNSKITVIKFIFLVFSFNFLAILFASIFIFLIYLIFINTKVNEVLKDINWGELIYSLLNFYICSLTLGALMGIIFSKVNLVIVLGFCLIIISTTFSGQFIPLSVISSSDAIKYISLFSPISYSLNMLNIVLVPNNKDLIIEASKTLEVLPSMQSNLDYIENYNFNGLFDIKNQFNIFDFSVNQIEDVPTITRITILNIYYPWQNILNLIMPYVFSIIFVFISIKKFSWVSR